MACPKALCSMALAFITAGAPLVVQAQSALAKLDVRSIKACFGTEPFWDLTIRKDEIKFEHDGNVMVIRGVPANSAKGTSETFIALYQGKVVGKERFLNVIITKDGRCNDGMSETSYPARVHILSGKDLYTGCCK